MSRKPFIEPGSVKRKKDDDFRIYNNIKDFPATELPRYLNESIGGVCICGTATIQVFGIDFKIEKGAVVTLLPWQLVSIKDVSEDFSITFFKVSLVMFMDSLSTLWRLRPGFFFYMRKHISSKPDEDNIERFLNFCELLDYRTKYAPAISRRESIMQLLRVYYWDIYAIYISCSSRQDITYTHKEELAFKFMQMIIEEHSPDKDVAYYACKLSISPKYLTNLIRSISGHSAHEWIVYYTIIEIKALLRETSMDLKSIVFRVNFPDQATLTRFFRRYAGMTPSKYRESIYF